ncbi:MAG: sialidase family protein [Myxococcota bacterium]|nr:sialidase family protein [Myxococcota bacterium]
MASRFSTAFFVSLIGAGVFAGCSSTPSTDAPTEVPRYDEIVLFEVTDTYPIFRIPSLIETPTGAILAFAEGRESLYDDGDIDLVMRRSDDDGATWGPIEVIIDAGADTAGNPTPVVDETTGRIWLPYCTNPAADGRNLRRMWITYSDDDGVSWAEPRELTDALRQDDWGWVSLGPGRGIQLASGRLLIPANHSSGDNIRQAHTVYSDDHGETWQLGGDLGAGTDESQLVELSDGRVMMNSRYVGEEHFRAISYSEDEGTTWSDITLDENLPEPICQGSILNTVHGLVFTNPATQEEFPRDRMTVRISQDEGQSWPSERLLDRGPSAYSATAVLSDGRIAVLWESGDLHPYEKLKFAAFNVAWVNEAAP